MEFFKIITVKSTEEIIQERLIFANIESISSYLFDIGKKGEREMSIGSLWGDFTLYKDVIKGGVRFALKECPNALAWSVTTGYPPDRDAVVIHLTINRIRIRNEFQEEIDEFIEDQSNRICVFLS